MKRWFWNCLIGIDQFGNALFGPLLNLLLQPSAAYFGDPDETLSSVFGKNVQSGDCRGCRLVCRILNWIDPGHCRESIEEEDGKNAR